MEAERCKTSRRSGKEHCTIKEQPMRKTVAKAFLAVFILTGAATALSACNTTAGAGKDISNTGKAITNEAEKDK
jgi:predicted small secreted protein